MYFSKCQGRAICDLPIQKVKKKRWKKKCDKEKDYTTTQIFQKGYKKVIISFLITASPPPPPPPALNEERERESREKKNVTHHFSYCVAKLFKSEN